MSNFLPGAPRKFIMVRPAPGRLAHAFGGPAQDPSEVRQDLSPKAYGQRKLVKASAAAIFQGSASNSIVFSEA
jgi:hypothetical protein